MLSSLFGLKQQGISDFKFDIQNLKMPFQ